MNIRNFDLNLLRVFDALMRERNVSRAGERLALSQPAMSNALNRLRNLLDDQLLVRTAQGMQPTALAVELEQPIRAALAQIDLSLNRGSTFDPATSTLRFTIATTDYVELIAMPPVMEHLARVAPYLQIEVLALGATPPTELLENGDVDLALGRFPELPPRLQSHRWLSETLKLAARRDHPLVHEGLSLDEFMALKHIWVAGGQRKGMVDDWLKRQGLRRNLAYTTPSYLLAPHIVANSDLVVVLPTRLATYHARLLPLQLVDLPFTLEPFHLDLVWSSLRAQDQALQWLIGEISQRLLP